MNAKKLPPRALTVQFCHMPRSNSVKELVRQQAERLRRFDLSEGRCTVVIDREHGRRRGIIFKVLVRLTVPGKRTFMARAEEKSNTHEYLHASVRLAFDEIERQLEKQNRRMRRREARRMAA